MAGFLHQRVASPAILPLSIEDAKLHLRITHDLEDMMIRGLIEAARDYVETSIGRSLINTQWRYIMDCFPDSSIVELLISPLVTVDSITYYDADQVLQTYLATKYYALPRQGVPGLLILRSGEQWPGSFDRPDAVTITYTAGFGTTDEAVPANAKHGLKLIMAHWYENREAAMTGSVPREIELGLNALLRTLKTGYVPGVWL